MKNKTFAPSPIPLIRQVSAFQLHLTLTNAEHVQKGIWIKALGTKPTLH